MRGRFLCPTFAHHVLHNYVLLGCKSVKIVSLPGRQTKKSMASNKFHALKDSDSDSDDEDSVFRSDADKLEKKANNLFFQAFAQNKLSHFLLRQLKKLPLQE